MKIEESVKRTADKYIPRKDQGTLPGIAEAAPRRVSAAAIVALASFILWHKRNHVQGGIRAEVAFDAFCAILGTDGESIKKIIKSTEW